MRKNYITHDMGAREDPKLIRLQMDMGGLGLGIWWCLVEMLWENDGYLPMDSAAIAFSLRWAKPDEVQAVIFNYGLFDNDGTKFWSPGALSRIEEMKQTFQEIADRKEEASRRGRAAINARWHGKGNERAEGNTPTDTDVNTPVSTDVIQPNNSRNTFLTNYTNYTNITNNSSFGPGPEQEKRFLEIFFFDLNLTDPASEVRRFMDYYNANGWTLGKGRKVQDFEALARQWKAEDGKNSRLPKQFLGWFKALYISISENPGLQASILSDLAAGDMKGDRISMTFRTREIALELRAYVGNHFGNKFNNIDWRLLNG